MRAPSPRVQPLVPAHAVTARVAAPLLAVPTMNVALGTSRGLLGPEMPVALALTDKDAVLQSLQGDQDFLEPLRILQLDRTVPWREDCIGTNAIDLALRERGAFVTAGGQHFGEYLRSFAIAAAPLFGEDGNLRGCLALLSAESADKDVLANLAMLCAEAVGAQLALTATNHNLRRLLSEQKAIIDNISDGLLVVDRAGQVRHMNVPAGRILSLNPEQSIGKRFSDLLDFEPIIAPIFETGTGYVDRELIIDSERRHLHLMDTAVPITNDRGEVESVVNTFREIQRVRQMAQQIAGNHARYVFEDIIGNSEPLARAIGRARKAAMSSATVLLSGESGTGKEVFAQAIHAASDRKGAPFVAINCAALPRDLIESELFGYVAGSFTGAQKGGRPGKFELASGGTIFLDEVTEMPLDVQAKLLRVLQEREVMRIGGSRAIPIDVRVIAASNRDMKDAITHRQFRADLFYRLNVLGIAIPALRERIEDIPALAHHFLKRYATALGKPLFQISEPTLRQMKLYPWPGNIRELENTIERLVNLADEDEISNFDLAPVPVPSTRQERVPVKTLREHERDIIAATLSRFGDNVTRAAAALDISRVTLYGRIREYGLHLSRTSTASRADDEARE